MQSVYLALKHPASCQHAGAYNAGFIFEFGDCDNCILIYQIQRIFFYRSFYRLCDIVLCIHGEKDFRILANQAMAAFDAAVMRGVPAELLIYPDENHWVLKPQNGILWQRTFFEWLDKWLKPAEK